MSSFVIYFAAMLNFRNSVTNADALLSLILQYPRRTKVKRSALNYHEYIVPDNDVKKVIDTIDKSSLRTTKEILLQQTMNMRTLSKQGSSTLITCYHDLLFDDYFVNRHLSLFSFFSRVHLQRNTRSNALSYIHRHFPTDTFVQSYPTAIVKHARWSSYLEQIIFVLDAMRSAKKNDDRGYDGISDDDYDLEEENVLFDVVGSDAVLQALFGNSHLPPFSGRLSLDQLDRLTTVVISFHQRVSDLHQIYYVYTAFKSFNGLAYELFDIKYKLLAKKKDVRRVDNMLASLASKFINVFTEVDKHCKLETDRARLREHMIRLASVDADDYSSYPAQPAEEKLIKEKRINEYLYYLYQTYVRSFCMQQLKNSKANQTIINTLKSYLADTIAQCDGDEAKISTILNDAFALKTFGITSTTVIESWSEYLPDALLSKTFNDVFIASSVTDAIEAFRCLAESDQHRSNLIQVMYRIVSINRRAAIQCIERVAGFDIYQALSPKEVSVSSSFTSTLTKPTWWIAIDGDALFLPIVSLEHISHAEIMKQLRTDANSSNFSQRSDAIQSMLAYSLNPVIVIDKNKQNVAKTRASNHARMKNITVLVMQRYPVTAYQSTLEFIVKKIKNESSLHRADILNALFNRVNIDDLDKEKLSFCGFDKDEKLLTAYHQAALLFEPLSSLPTLLALYSEMLQDALDVQDIDKHSGVKLPYFEYDNRDAVAQDDKGKVKTKVEYEVAYTVRIRQHNLLGHFYRLSIFALRHSLRLLSLNHNVLNADISSLFHFAVDTQYDMLKFRFGQSMSAKFFTINFGRELLADFAITETSNDETFISTVLSENVDNFINLVYEAYAKVLPETRGFKTDIYHATDIIKVLKHDWIQSKTLTDIVAARFETSSSLSSKTTKNPMTDNAIDSLLSSIFDYYCHGADRFTAMPSFLHTLLQSLMTSTKSASKFLPLYIQSLLYREFHIVNSAAIIGTYLPMRKAHRRYKSRSRLRNKGDAAPKVHGHQRFLIKSFLVNKLLSTAPSTIYLPYVYRFLLRYQQQTLTDKYLSEGVVIDGPFAATITDNKKWKGVKGEAKLVRAKGRRSRIKADLAQDDDDDDDDDKVPFAKQLIIPVCFGLHRLLPSQCRSLGAMYLSMASNVDLPTLTRVKALIFYTLLPSTSYVDIIKHISADVKTEDDHPIIDDDGIDVNVDDIQYDLCDIVSKVTIASSNKTKPKEASSAKPFIEALLKGLLRTDDKLAPLPYLLHQKFLKQDFARIAIYAVSSVISKVDCDKLNAIFKYLFEGELRYSFKISAYKELIRLVTLNDSNGSDSKKILLNELKRKHLHRDGKIVLIQMAKRLLSTCAINGDEMDAPFKILIASLSSDEPEVLLNLLAVRSQNQSQRSLSTRGIGMDAVTENAQIAKYVSTLAVSSLPQIAYERYFKDILLPLATDAKYSEDIRFATLFMINKHWQSHQHLYLSTLLPIWQGILLKSLSSPDLKAEMSKKLFDSQSAKLAKSRFQRTAFELMSNAKHLAKTMTTGNVFKALSKVDETCAAIVATISEVGDAAEAKDDDDEREERVEGRKRQRYHDRKMSEDDEEEEGTTWFERRTRCSTTSATEPTIPAEQAAMLLFSSFKVVLSLLSSFLSIVMSDDMFHRTSVLPYYIDFLDVLNANISDDNFIAATLLKSSISSSPSISSLSFEHNSVFASVFFSRIFMAELSLSVDRANAKIVTTTYIELFVHIFKYISTGNGSNIAFILHELIRSEQVIEQKVIFHAALFDAIVTEYEKINGSMTKEEKPSLIASRRAKLSKNFKQSSRDVSSIIPLIAPLLSSSSSSLIVSFLLTLLECDISNHPDCMTNMSLTTKKIYLRYRLLSLTKTSDITLLSMEGHNNINDITKTQFPLSATLRSCDGKENMDSIVGQLLYVNQTFSVKNEQVIIDFAKLIFSLNSDDDTCASQWRLLNGLAKSCPSLFMYLLSQSNIDALKLFVSFLSFKYDEDKVGYPNTVERLLEVIAVIGWKRTYTEEVYEFEPPTTMVLNDDAIRIVDAAIMNKLFTDATKVKQDENHDIAFDTAYVISSFYINFLLIDARLTASFTSFVYDLIVRRIQSFTDNMSMITIAFTNMFPSGTNKAIDDTTAAKAANAQKTLDAVVESLLKSAKKDVVAVKLTSSASRVETRLVAEACVLTALELLIAVGTHTAVLATSSPSSSSAIHNDYLVWRPEYVTVLSRFHNSQYESVRRRTYFLSTKTVQLPNTVKADKRDEDQLIIDRITKQQKLSNLETNSTLSWIYRLHRKGR